MKLFRSPLFLGLFALVFSLSSITYAAGARKKPTPVPSVTTVIESIAADSITVAAGPKKKTYKITAQTRFTFNGEYVAAAVMKAGMRVNVTPGSDETIAEEVSATGPRVSATPAGATTGKGKGKGN